MTDETESIPCPWCDAPLGDGDKCAACGREPIVCEHFRVVRVLGRGGMGVVYEGERVGPARDHGKKHGPHVPARVAIKILAPPSDDDWTAWELFERSSKVLQQLHHERLPKVHAFERTDRGRLVLVREPFDGGTLEERISGADDRISPDRVRELLDEMLELLEYLQGLVPPVVHRDIKPSNVMFRTKGDWEPVLVDFDTIVSRKSGLTIVGTPGYAAPEQFAADASPASDVYGLGATMLFVATHTDADELPKEHGRFVLDGLLPSLDEHVREVLARMVEPDLAKRYETAREARDDLARKPRKAAPAPKPATSASPKRAPAAFAGPPPQKSRARLAWLLAIPAVVVADRVVEHHHFGRKEPPSWMYDSDALPPSTATVQTPDQVRDEKACKSGDGEACFNAALRYDDGTGGMPKNYAVAAGLYERGCKLGHTGSCNNLAVDYQHGYGVDASVAKARDLYQGACTAQNALACRNLGFLYEGDAGAGVIPPDLDKAFAYFTRACDLEDGNACNNLGWMYEDGEGTKKDLKKAASLYLLACDQGYLYGCRNGGIAYETADGVDRDDRRAVALFRRACTDDEKSGCLELGRMTKDGRGTFRDLAGAADDFQKGCDDGWLDACDELARLYAKGSGVGKDVSRAKKLFARACDGGVSGSCGELRSLGR